MKKIWAVKLIFLTLILISCAKSDESLPDLNGHFITNTYYDGFRCAIMPEGKYPTLDIKKSIDGYNVTLTQLYPSKQRFYFHNVTGEYRDTVKSYQEFNDEPRLVYGWNAYLKEYILHAYLKNTELTFFFTGAKK